MAAEMKRLAVALVALLGCATEGVVDESPDGAAPLKGAGAASDVTAIVQPDAGRDSVGSEAQILECPLVRACVSTAGCPVNGPTYEWVITATTPQSCDSALALARTYGCPC